MKKCILLPFLVSLTMGAVGIPSVQSIEPAAYFSGTIFIYGTKDPIPGSMTVLLKHRAQADVYVCSGGEWRLDWRSGYWIEKTVVACPEYEQQISIDEYNSEFPPAEEGAIHVQYSYGDSSETVLYNQNGWCVVGPHVQANGSNMDRLEWYVMAKAEDQNDNLVLDVFEQPLIERFCPSIVLHSADQGVSPEPVRIMAPAHARYLWARTYNILGNASEWRISDDWDPPVSYYYGWLETRNYSFIDGGAYMYVGSPPGAAFQPYFLIFHFEWADQGNSPSDWRAAYSSEAANNQFPNTVYAHLHFLGTTYLIQYWFFYPFNDYINNHEGDWEHINVVVDSQNPADAHIVRVEYYFHHHVVSAFHPGVDFFLEDGSHPIVFVGGSGSTTNGSGDGSHGSFPVNGLWSDSGGGCCWLVTKPDEMVDGEGKYIRYDEFSVVNVPEPDAINYFEHPEWSWLKANVPWGHSHVSSPGDWLEDFSWLSLFFGECCFPDDLGDSAPCGPAYNGGWNCTGQVDGWYDGYSKEYPYCPVTETNWVPPCTTRGDFNGDGMVDIVDVIGVIEIILHLTDPSPYQFWAANMKDDGAINILDVVAVVNSILGVSPESDSLLQAACTVGLFQKSENEYEVRLDNASSISGVQLHLPFSPAFQFLRKTERSSALDSAYCAGSEEVIIVLYSSTGDLIEAGSGSILDLSFSENENPCVTEVVVAAPEGRGVSVVLQLPPHTVSLYPLKDAYMSAHPAYQTYNYGARGFLGTGRNWKYTDYIFRSLLQFDFSPIPSGAVVDEALLHLFVEYNGRCLHDTDISVYRMEHSWEEGTGDHELTDDGATWLTSDGVTPWISGPGADGSGDCEQTPVGVVTIPHLADLGQEVVLSLNISAVEAMLDGGSFENHGFLIKDDDEFQDLYRYYSSESGLQIYWPRLEIIYRGCGSGGSGSGEENIPPSITVTNPPAEGATATDTYTITWTSGDPDADVCTVDLFYDTNTSSGGETQIVLNAADERTYTWNTSGVSEGSYYVYGVIDDGNGGTDSDYSAGRVTIDHGETSPCDLPYISSLNPASGDIGSAVWIFGDSFGDIQGQGYVTFFPNQMASISIWSNAEIKCAVPVGVENGDVTVTTDCGTSSGKYFTVTQGGCPYLSPWIGDRYAVGNNILAASEDTNRAGLNVVDHFRLEQPCVEKDERYWLQIREFEQEHTWLDEIKLKTVDHPKGQHLGVTDEGELFLYKREIGPVSCVDSAGLDQLGLINTIGDGDYEGFPADWLTVDFGQIGNPRHLYVEIVADLLPLPPKDQTIVLQLRGEHEWDWRDIALLHPRQHWATHMVDLSSYVDRRPRDIIIRLYWLAQHKVDYIGLAYSVPGPVVEQECALASAVHSVVGEVTDSLSIADETYAELLPGQKIEVAFLPSKSREGFKRDFIVVATGYYMMEMPGVLPKASLSDANPTPSQYWLSQNHPNPFNLSTDIRYQIADRRSPLHTTLKVFNVMGQEIRTLVHEEKKAGVYTVTWDGRDAYGREVSSGVYFCRLSAGDCTATRRMVLLR